MTIESQPTPAVVANTADLYRQARTVDGLRKISGLRVTRTAEISDTLQQPPAAAPPTNGVLLLAAADHAPGIECTFGTRYADRVARLRTMAGPITIRATVAGFDDKTMRLQLREVALLTSRWKLNAWTYTCVMVNVAAFVGCAILWIRLLRKMKARSDEGDIAGCIQGVAVAVAAPLAIPLVMCGVSGLMQVVFDALDIPRPAFGL